MLQVSGVGVVSCVIQRDEGRAPTRHCFQWSHEHHYFAEEPLLRHVEPPLSNLLELVMTIPVPTQFFQTLRTFHTIKIVPRSFVRQDGTSLQIQYVNRIYRIHSAHYQQRFLAGKAEGFHQHAVRAITQPAVVHLQCRGWKDQDSQNVLEGSNSATKT